MWQGDKPWNHEGLSGVKTLGLFSTGPCCPLSPGSRPWGLRQFPPAPPPRVAGDESSLPWCKGKTVLRVWIPRPCSVVGDLQGHTSLGLPCSGFSLLSDGPALARGIRTPSGWKVDGLEAPAYSFYNRQMSFRSPPGRHTPCPVDSFPCCGLLRLPHAK